MLPDPASLATTIPAPHPSATILPVAAAHIPALRRINALLLPVNYSDSFYQGLLDPSVSGLFSRAVLWQDDPAAPPKVIGGLVCRLEPSPFDPSTGRHDASLAPGADHALYIQSLVLLAPYRGLGLVSAALEGIFDAARKAGAGGAVRVRWVYAHVWSANEEGLAWYGRRGFERDGLVQRYYWKLQPDSAWIVKKKVGPEDMSGREGEQGVGGQGTVDIPVSVTAAAVNLPGFALPVGGGAVPPRANGPPMAAASSRPPPQPHSLSFQNKRPDMEWNDLPEEMVTSKSCSRSDLLQPPSGSSSRSSSTGRKKKDRSYPTAAFGN